MNYKGATAPKHSDNQRDELLRLKIRYTEIIDLPIISINFFVEIVEKVDYIGATAPKHSRELEGRTVEVKDTLH